MKFGVDFRLLGFTQKSHFCNTNMAGEVTCEVQATLDMAFCSDVRLLLWRFHLVVSRRPVLPARLSAAEEGFWPTKLAKSRFAYILLVRGPYGPSSVTCPVCVCVCVCTCGPCPICSRTKTTAVRTATLPLT
jgi:hypothetical protein